LVTAILANSVSQETGSDLLCGTQFNLDIRPPGSRCNDFTIPDKLHGVGEWLAERLEKNQEQAKPSEFAKWRVARDQQQEEATA